MSTHVVAPGYARQLGDVQEPPSEHFPLDHPYSVLSTTSDIWLTDSWLSQHLGYCRNAQCVEEMGPGSGVWVDLFFVHVLDPSPSSPCFLYLVGAAGAVEMSPHAKLCLRALQSMIPRATPTAEQPTQKCAREWPEVACDQFLLRCR